MTRLPIIENPAKQNWASLLARPVHQGENLDSAVKILSEVKSRGDKAVDEYSLLFDQVAVEERCVQPDEFIRAENMLETD